MSLSPSKPKGAVTPGRSRTSAAGRPRGQSRKRGQRGAAPEDIRKRLQEMGTYSKYLSGLESSPFEVKVRCSCGRSRMASWMFVCTYCATGGIREEPKAAGRSAARSSLIPAPPKTTLTAGEQRPWLCCDMCTHKETISYFCPHCLGVYFGHLRKYTRCDRCVECPICTSPLEKIAYSGQKKKKAEDGSGEAEPSAEESQRASDTYLYQCPFCYWSSDGVHLSAADGDSLLKTLEDKFEKPLEEAEKVSADLAEVYKKKHRELQKQLKQGDKSKKIGFGTRASLLKQGAARMSSGRGMRSAPGFSTADASSLKSRTGKKRKRKKRKQRSALEFTKKLDDATAQKWTDTTLRGIAPKLPPDTDPTVGELKPDDPFLSAFQHLTDFAPLEHMFQLPLTQPTDFKKHIPQKYRLMTKEGYRCPHEGCHAYVCKPHVGGRGVKYDVRTPVLDYLPRVCITLMEGGLRTTAESIILLRFENRLMDEARISLEPHNAEDSEDSEGFTTVENLLISDRQFTIDAMDILVSGKPRYEQHESAPNPRYKDYVNGRELGIYLKFKPKMYTANELRFSLYVAFETQICWKNESQRKGAKKTTKLDHILDVHLGMSLQPPLSRKTSLARKTSASIQSTKTAAATDTVAVTVTVPTDDSRSSTAPVTASPSPTPVTETTATTTVAESAAVRLAKARTTVSEARSSALKRAAIGDGTGSRGSTRALPATDAPKSSTRTHVSSAVAKTAAGRSARTSRTAPRVSRGSATIGVGGLHDVDGQQLSDSEFRLYNRGWTVERILKLRGSAAKRQESSPGASASLRSREIVETVDGVGLTTTELRLYKTGMSLDRIQKHREMKEKRASATASSAAGTAKARTSGKDLASMRARVKHYRKESEKIKARRAQRTESSKKLDLGDDAPLPEGPEGPQ